MGATPANAYASPFALGTPPSAILKTSNRRRLIVASIFTFTCVLSWEREFRLMFDDPSPLASTSAAATLLPACTKEASVWPKPNTLSSTKYESVLRAEKILAFIITKLDEIGAPIILMFGTALHEFRNGTRVPGPCLRPNHNDKDIDIAVFQDHFHYIFSFEKDIREIFGWEFITNDMGRSRTFTTIQPFGISPAAMEMGLYFQIDIYGFCCQKSNDIIFFPWDRVTIANNAFLPVRKHKLILGQTDSGATNTTNKSTHWNSPGFYMPFDPHCLLTNIYGSDYMTPKTGKSSQARWGTHFGGRPAYNNPKCNSTLSTFEKYELDRQLIFCSGVVPNPD